MCADWFPNPHQSLESKGGIPVHKVRQSEASREKIYGEQGTILGKHYKDHQDTGLLAFAQQTTKQQALPIIASMLFKRQQKKMVELQETHSFCLHVFSNFPTWSAYYLCDSLLKTGCLGPCCSCTPAGQSDSSWAWEDLAVFLKMYNARQLPVSSDCRCQIHILLLLTVLTWSLLYFFPVVDTEEGQEEVSESSYPPVPSENLMIPKAPEPLALSEGSPFYKLLAI